MVEIRGVGDKFNLKISISIIHHQMIYFYCTDVCLNGQGLYSMYVLSVLFFFSQIDLLEN